MSSLPQYLQDSFKTDGVTMAWGSDGFFWYSLCTPVDDQGEASVQWWSTHESPTPVRRDQTPSVIQEQLLARHGHWNSPYDTPESTIHEIIIKLGCSSAGGKDNLLILPRYTIPRIPHWSTPSGSGRIILLGDAAHTMSPESAQGISSAAEDALAIGLLLRHYCATRSLDLPEALRQVAKAYEKIRMKKVRFILKIARMSRYSMKKRTWCGERIRDLILRIFCTSFFHVWAVDPITNPLL